MRLPFGLDFVSVLVGVAFALWVLPWILGMFSRAKASKEA
jgi:hypothetical protein